MMRCALLLSLFCAAPAAAAAPAPAVVTWNELATRVAAAAPWNPLRESRALAITSAAVADAVRDAGSTEALDAAIAAAAHDALVALYPDARARVDDAERASLAALPAGPKRDAGIAAGRAAAARVLALRRHDGSVDVTAAPDGAGEWTPTPPGFAAALEPGWGRVTPFLVGPVARFRPGPPPAQSGPELRRDLEEVRLVGASASRTRSAAQTDAARLWGATATQLWNQAARQLVVARRLESAEAARLFAELNMAGADALIAAWDAKYTYRQRRPVTAIRAGGDASWTPLLPTPPFPDYPAGHTAYAGAAEVVLGAWLGGERIDVALTSGGAPAVTRRYHTIADIADEVVGARVWAGVHWRSSCTAGRELGRAVGRAALAARERGDSRARR